jgi:hypothetical protein
MADKSPKEAVNIIIAEFQAMRTEIDNALSSQQTMININVTAIAVISGLVLAHKVAPLLLLIAAAISSGLGLYVLGSWYHVRRVISYINGFLRPLAIEYTGDERMLAWETWSLGRGGAWKRVALLGLATLIIFSVMPFVMLVWSIPHLESLSVWLAWSGTATIFIVQLSAGVWLGWDILRGNI